MCGIAGFIGTNAWLRTCDMIEVLRHRGPDRLSVWNGGVVCMAHAHLRITGDYPQPVLVDGKTFVYNGEIYNFSDFSPGDSDTVAVASILKSGVENFARMTSGLAGEYACAVWDGHKIVLFRDPVGIKPLFYGHNAEGFGFASERKALRRAGISDIKSLTPGTTFVDGMELKLFDLPEQRPKIFDIDLAVGLLDGALSKSVSMRLHKKAAVTFSGGVDSALIGAMSGDTPLLTVGLKDSHDIKAATNAAKLMGAEGRLKVFEITDKDVEAALPGTMYAIESTDQLKVSIALPLYILSQKARDDGYRVLLSGQGADELFAGYSRYESGFKEGRLAGMLDYDLRHIADVNLERDDAAAMAHGVELRVPYLDMGVIEIARWIDPSLKVSFNGKDYIRKYVLRRMAEKYLPHEVSSAPKKAIQYGTSVNKTLERLAKASGKDVAGYLNSLYRVVLE